MTGITEFQIPAGKVYFSPVIDCFDGLVIRWPIGTHPGAELVNTMLDAAIEMMIEPTTGPLSTQIVAPNIAGQAGCRISEKRNSSTL